MKEISNQWCTEKQHHIHGETYEHIKPEYRIVVIVGRLLDIDKGLRKATALQITCNECKDGKNADDSIISRSEQSGQEYSERIFSICVEPLFIAPQNNPLAVFSFNVSAIFSFLLQK